MKRTGRPREWKSETISSLRVPKTTVSPVRAVAHAIDDGLVTEAQVMEWIQEMQERPIRKQPKSTEENHVKE